MDRGEFLKQQYLTLREEIKETKSRIFYIAAIGLFVVPGGQYLAKAMDADLVLLVLPFLVICVGLLYLAENHALMRCGRYIKKYIESEIHDHLAWEEWLESTDMCCPRSVDKYVGYAFYLLVFIYYAVSVVAAYRASLAWRQTAPWMPEALLGLYGGLGVITLYILAKNVRSTTTTSTDPVCSKKVSA